MKKHTDRRNKMYKKLSFIIISIKFSQYEAPMVSNIVGYRLHLFFSNIGTLPVHSNVRNNDTIS